MLQKLLPFEFTAFFQSVLLMYDKLDVMDFIFYEKDDNYFNSK
ncbi:hypothetical protein [Flavobacterium chungbukense]|nr:hypothetical protein [Flavobacterium chungbukense]